MIRALLDQVRRLADDRCDYCRIPRRFDPLPFQLDHIIAEQHGGETILENLAWSCLHQKRQPSEAVPHENAWEGPRWPSTAKRTGFELPRWTIRTRSGSLPRSGNS